jgi:hypothetical protein
MKMRCMQGAATWEPFKSTYAQGAKTLPWPTPSFEECRGVADVAFPLWPIPSDKTADGHPQSRAYSHSKRFGVQGVRTREAASIVTSGGEWLARVRTHSLIT